MTVNYRETHGMFACNRVLFNRESPRRGENFVTGKTTRGVAVGLETGTRLRLGSVDVRRGWGRACAYVGAMWPMLQQPAPSDDVTGTGISRLVRHMVQVAFGLVGLDSRDNVDLDPAYIRPTEVPDLLADPSTANRELGWYPRISFEAMIREMLQSDIRAAGLDPDQRMVAVPVTQVAPL